MNTTERQTTRPNGLARFLVAHGECAEGYETIRDRGVVTVICRGCDASFSFLTNSRDRSRREVEAALVELAEASGPDRPSPNGAAPNGAAPEHDDPPSRKPIHTPVLQGSAKRLPPPGPLAPQRRRARTLSERFGPPLDEAGRRLVRAVERRRRPIALTALGLAGAYILIALTVGGPPSSSQGSRALGGPQLPVAAPTPSAPDDDSLAGAALPMQTFQAGGPEVQDPVAGAAQFSVALPPDWGSSLGVDGRTLLGPTAGGSEVQVIASPRDDLGITEMAEVAAGFLGQGISPGHQVERLTAQPVGNLFAVARATTDSGVRTAYIGLGETASYLVIDHTRNDASALVRVQTQGVISSFEPG